MTRRAQKPNALLLRCRSAAIALMEAHAKTVMVGRTLMQQAMPITFGAKVAQWLWGLAQAHLGERLRAVRVPKSQPSRRRKRVVHFYDISFERPPKR